MSAGEPAHASPVTNSPISHKSSPNSRRWGCRSTANILDAIACRLNGHLSRLFSVGHDDESLFLIPKRIRAPEEESLGGQGAQGGIHKVDVGERTIVVALFA